MTYVEPARYISPLAISSLAKFKTAPRRFGFVGEFFSLSL